MKRWLIAALKAVLLWLEPPPDRSLIVQRAIEIARQVQTGAPSDPTGEWRRHQTLARLIDAFPEERIRVLARAIEDAVEAL